MQIIVCETPDEGADLVTREILRRLESKPDLVLGLATGSTPIGVYERLVRLHREKGVDFSRVRTFNLDEYIGLSAEHPQSYRFFMRRHLFDALNIPAANIHFPPTEGPELQRKCREYDEKIQAVGGIDIQILGIGSNGQIGFNEPTSSLRSGTRVKTLTEKTLRDNSRFYSSGETQPHLATTMGIGTILGAKRILLQAFGEKKADAIRAIVEGPISAFWPGSVLQLHPETTLFLDRASASRL
ncbi:MAG TPA: glucosamine-6-phosphate deaminase, partial [Planctomycetota bacterium]|nr:glucosamine-6-phosphate deaminase [Planctomycetota bacterium]